MIELALKNVVKFFGATKVLEDISFEVQKGERVGIVGRNGCGKSTVLKIIAGEEDKDSGDVMIRKGATLGYLAQMPEFPDGTKVVDVLKAAFLKLDEIEENMKLIEKKMSNIEGDKLERLLNEYSRLQHSFEASGGYEKQEKLSRVCVGLKFSQEFLNKSFNILSGGEKTTVVLGKILLEAPDILLLDEPTNHLDVEAVEWLEDYLREYSGTVVIVSHDRYFLDRVAGKIVEIEDMASETYNGNYSNYIRQKEENLMLQFEQYKEQQKKIKAMEKAIKDLRDWAIRADNNKFFRRAESMQKRLDKMEKIDRPVLERENIKLNFKETARSGRDVIKVEKLVKGFDDKTLFYNAELLIRYGERTALIGPNGSGKSTFLRMLLGEEMADEGEAKLGASIKYGYLPQVVSFEDEEMTVLECFRDGITIPEGKAREYLSKFLFFGNSVFKKVKGLSGGEKSRLKLSRLLYDEVNLLILDEPTNHLDIDSIEELEEALLSFEGTIFFISHDRYFINKISTRIIALEDKKFVSYPGDYEYYREKKSSVEGFDGKPKLKKDTREVQEQTVKAERKNEFKIMRLEEKINEIELEIEETENLINQSSTEYELLNMYIQQRDNLNRELEELMGKWIEIS